jgi:transcriptional regulator with XRE-family HTH domain
MRTSELLKDCKLKLGVTTDYALAKALNIDRARVADYMKGKRQPTTYALVKIAEILKLNPLELIAEYEELSAKNETEKSFWSDFRQRVKPPLKGFIMALLCTLSLLTGYVQAQNAGGVFRLRKYA